MVVSINRLNNSDIRSLLECQNEEFLEKAYLKLLDRKPDMIGLMHYARRLQSGIPRQVILAEIWNGRLDKRAISSKSTKLIKLMARYQVVRGLPLGRIRWLLIPRFGASIPDATGFDWISWASTFSGTSEKSFANKKNRFQGKLFDLSEDKSIIKDERNSDRDTLELEGKILRQERDFLQQYVDALKENNQAIRRLLLQLEIDVTDFLEPTNESLVVNQLGCIKQQVEDLIALSDDVNILVEERKARLYPLNMISRSSKGLFSWFSLGEDPHFLIQVEHKLVLKAGWFRIKLVMRSEHDQINAKLYFNYGSGFCEADTVSLPYYNNGIFVRLFYVTQDVKDIRFDPQEVKGNFIVELLHIDRIDDKQATALMLEHLHNQEQYPEDTQIEDIWNDIVLKAQQEHSEPIKELLGLYNDTFVVRLNFNDYKNWVKYYDTIKDVDRVEMLAHISTFNVHPFISVIMPTYNTPEKFLRKAIESIRYQIYPYWELCIADDASTAQHVRCVLEEYAQKDSRIKVFFRKQNGNISAASNSALELATGEYIALVDHDDEISEHALYMVAECINKYGNDVDIIYSDEDKINQDGERYDPYFKTKWNRYFIYSQNFVAHLGVYRKSIVKDIGGFRVGYEGSQDYDLLLRVLEKTSEDRIKHIPFVLYHWRNFPKNITFSSTQHHISDQSAYHALNEFFSRANERVLLTESNSVKGCWNQLFELYLQPSVTIIIPTKDNLEILRTCIDSLIFNTDYQGELEVIIVDNFSKKIETFEYYKAIKNLNAPFRLVVMYDKGEFNYSRLNNMAVSQASGDIIVFLNNDVKTINKNWLKRMVSIATREDVGVVGAKLLYDNNTVQHVGVTLGIYGIASHPFRGIPSDQNIYFGFPNLLREVSSVTAACMGVKKSLFLKVGGFDETLFPISYNDVDLSLKLLALGYKNIFDPMIRLYHFESRSRGADDSLAKIMQHRRASKNMILKYGSLLKNDYYYSPNLSLENENFEISFPPRIAKPWRNWIEFLVPFHRGDVLLAAQVAEYAHNIGIPLRLHVSSELKNIVTDLNPSYKVETVACGLPNAENTSAYYEVAKKLVQSRLDFSGKFACVHGDVDFKTNGLNIVEKMLHELELPIDSLLNNIRPYPSKKQSLSVNRKTLLLHPVGGWDLKSMPEQFVDKLVNYFNLNGYDVVQIGGEKDKIFASCNANILKNYSLTDWVPLFESAAAVLCVDSWISHFAAIMDVNHVVFYGSTNSFYTNSRRHFVEKNSIFKIVETLVDCSPCDNLECKLFPKNYCHSFDLIELESLDEFLLKIETKQ